MRKNSRIAAFLCISMGFLFAGALHINSQEPLRILFIGSSYFNYNNLPEIFYGLAEGGGKKIYIDENMPSGSFLSDHTEMQLTRLKIKSNSWDYVVLQGTGMVMAYQDSIPQHPFIPAMGSLVKIIKRKNPSATILFCLPWAYEDGMTWKEGWTDGYAEMQQKIISNTLDYAERMEFKVAPVGIAWFAVLKDRDYPQHYLHFTDWNHPNKKGSYLTACVLYSSIFHESSTSISFTAGLDPGEARYLRKMASETVLEK